MRGICPHLWIVEDAEGAVDLYTSLFEDAEIIERLNYTEAGQDIHGREPGSTMTIDFTLAGRKLVALEGGPYNTLNPSISLTVDCPSAEELDRLWERLSVKGKALMERDSHDWAPRFGWIEDRFGLSWQLIFAGDEAPSEKQVVPSFMFAGDLFGRGREAIDFYTSIFDDSGIDAIVLNGGNGAGGAIMWSQFTLAGEKFRLMENDAEHAFSFNDAFSLLIECDSQEEIDRYWETLLEGGSPTACGWLRDRFGVAWQVAPVQLQEMLREGDTEQVVRVTDTFMKMEKLDLAALEAAYASR